MDAVAAFETWAPCASPWSRWAKGVLFSFMDEEMPIEAAEAEQNGLTSWTPPRGHTALVIDLPGAASVHQGLAVALQGWRPVPLYTSLPVGWEAEVPMEHVLRALVQGVEVLRALVIPAAAQPAFLLDSRRLYRRGSHAEESFDNRTMVLPSELPSAAFLQSQGIREVVVMTGSRLPQPDLAQVLGGWVGGGLAVKIEVGGRISVWKGNTWLQSLLAVWRHRESACLCGPQGRLPRPVPDVSMSRGSG